MKNCIVGMLLTCPVGGKVGGQFLSVRNPSLTLCRHQPFLILLGFGMLYISQCIAMSLSNGPKDTQGPTILGLHTQSQLTMGACRQNYNVDKSDPWYLKYIVLTICC